MTIGSLFSGIGGLELGLERAGLGRVAWQVEADPTAREVLEAHWPDAQRFNDVRTFCGPRDSAEAVSLICGGFPCQDLSVAGKGAGIAHGARSSLWREMVRIVDECQPEVVVVENVAQGLSRWQGVVEFDLADLGYVPATVIVPAGSVGAPHRRARAFVVADTHGQFLRFVQQRGPRGPSVGVRDEGGSRLSGRWQRRGRSPVIPVGRSPPSGSNGRWAFRRGGPVRAKDRQASASRQRGRAIGGRVRWTRDRRVALV